MSKLKICKICGRRKPLTDFYTHPQTADGYLGKCKECQRAAAKAAKIADLKRYQEYDRQRGTLPHRLAAVAAYKETEHGRERISAGQKTWIKRNPDKRKAHIWVSNAIRDGRLIREPCEICGTEKATAHHDDYSKPMEVRWFCGPCHRAHHKAEREAMRLNSEQGG